MVDEFDEVAFALPVGKHSPVFRTVFGFHIAKVLVRVPEGVRPLSDVKEQIERHLHEEARRAEMEKYVDALKAKAEIRKTTAVAG
jgi:parvulin-like peptidyl-prolyl isomerase